MSPEVIGVPEWAVGWSACVMSRQRRVKMVNRWLVYWVGRVDLGVF